MTALAVFMVNNHCVAAVENFRPAEMAGPNNFFSHSIAAEVILRLWKCGFKGRYRIPAPGKSKKIAGTASAPKILLSCSETSRQHNTPAGSDQLLHRQIENVTRNDSLFTHSRLD